MKDKPIAKVKSEYFVTKVFWNYEVNNGKWLPKYRNKNTPPKKSIPNKPKGIKIYAAIVGMTNVVIATSKHIPAPIPKDVIIYGNCCSADRKGNCFPLW